MFFTCFSDWKTKRTVLKCWAENVVIINADFLRLWGLSGVFMRKSSFEINIEPLVLISIIWNPRSKILSIFGAVKRKMQLFFYAEHCGNIRFFLHNDVWISEIIWENLRFSLEKHKASVVRGVIRVRSQHNLTSFSEQRKGMQIDSDSTEIIHKN